MILLCAIWFVLGVAAAVGILILAGAGYLTSALRTRRRRVLIVGGAGFCHTLESVARGHRRVSVSCVPPGHGEDALRRVRSGDDVVVDGAFLDDLRPGLAAALAARAHVYVVPVGMSGLHVFEEPLFFVHRILKRSMDVSLALILLTATLPLLLVAMLAIKLESRGPALFVHSRAGLGGRSFSLYKLRTMLPADEDEDREYLRALVQCAATSGQGIFKPRHAARVTRIGVILRRYSIDELPQLVNVLKGDMSIVGPRPDLLHQLDVYDEICMQRLRVKPGITGLSQVSGRSSLAYDRIVRTDLEYCEYWSPMLELKILAKTAIVVLTARGAG